MNGTPPPCGAGPGFGGQPRPVGPNVPLFADQPGADHRPGPAIGHPAGTAGWPAPARSAPLRKSRKGLIIGLVGGFCVLALIGCAIAGFNVWQHHQQEQATLAIYHRIGRPTGFDEQGEPRRRYHTELSATWVGPTQQSHELVDATSDWLGRHSKNPPSRQDVQDAFVAGRSFHLDDQDPANVELTLSMSGADLQIDVSIIS